uniref:Acyltransferase n=1 Tax=Trichobilharzia regenti TaxID=157069 RepID=A0AA85JR11_TRIRE|nr:unnamed protein product [Trichobilharzia regenti]
MYAYCLKIFPILSNLLQHKRCIHLKQTIFQYLSVLSFVLTFVFCATTCWLIWIYSIIKLFKLSYTIGNELMKNEELMNNPYEIINHEEVMHSVKHFSALFIFITTYWIYWRIDKGAEEKGSHPKKFIRNLIIWKYLASYFPIKLVLSELCNSDTHGQHQTEVNTTSSNETSDNNHDCSINRRELACVKELFPTTKNYLVGYHPHGIFGIGSFVNFLTEANQFSAKFPGITPWVATLEINFKAPFHRDLFLRFNLVAATYKGISYLLDPEQCGNTGNFVVVVLGGAPEALDSRPGKYVFHTNRRYGFFKLAMLTGSDLVPCVSFGEPNMYKQVHNPEGSWLRRFQNRFTEMATFSPPLFYANCLIPYRTSVNTVIGRPIPCKKNLNPTREEVSMLKELYLKELQNLYNKYKPIYDPDSELTYV